MFRAEQGCVASPDIVVRKPGALWDALLKNFSLATVEDLSPGSGSLATACMRSGVGCVCYVWSSLHATWLGNVLNREAAKLIVDTDSVLYQQSLAEALAQMFSDELKDAAEEEPEEPAVEEK